MYYNVLIWYKGCAFTGILIIIIIIIFFFYFTIPPGTCKEAEAYRAGFTIFTKLNDLSADKNPSPAVTWTPSNMQSKHVLWEPHEIILYHFGSWFIMKIRYWSNHCNNQLFIYFKRSVRGSVAKLVVQCQKPVSWARSFFLTLATRHRSGIMCFTK